ncbi:MAG: hypothetical protein GY754_12040 [bacterium]|nr:hypothetical protein [bacterium]
MTGKQEISVIFKGSFQEAQKILKALKRNNIEAFLENPSIDAMDTQLNSGHRVHLYVYQPNEQQAERTLARLQRKQRIYTRRELEAKGYSYSGHFSGHVAFFSTVFFAGMYIAIINSLFQPALWLLAAYCAYISFIWLRRNNKIKKIILRKEQRHTIRDGIEYHDIDLVRECLEDTKADKNFSPLREAARTRCANKAERKDNLAIAELLIDAGAIINEEVVAAALYHHKTDLIKLFLSKNKTIHSLTLSSNNFGRIQPLELIFTLPGKTQTERKNNTEMARLFIDAGARIHPLAVIAAIYHGKIDILKLFLNHTKADSIHQTNSATEMLRNMNVSIKSMFEYTILPLLYACTPRGDPQIIPLLVKHGCDITEPTPNGYTALHVAVSYNHKNTIAMIQACINAGANINAASDVGYTPLHLALLRQKQNRNEVVTVLLENSANPQAATNSNCGKHRNKTALDLADTEELTTLLKKYRGRFS